MTIIKFMFPKKEKQVTKEIQKDMKEELVDKFLIEFEKNKRLKNELLWNCSIENYFKIDQIKDYLSNCKMEVLEKQYKKVFKENLEIIKRKETIKQIDLLCKAFQISVSYSENDSNEKLQEILTNIRNGEVEEE